MDAARITYLTRGDASKLASPPLTPSAIRAAVQRGRLRVAAVTAGGVHLFERADVEAYLLGRQRRRTKAAA